MKNTTKIRWVIAHEPLNLFLRAAKDFEKRVNQQQSQINIDVEIMTLTEYSVKYNNGIAVTKHDLLDMMEQGKLEMSQMYTTWLAEKYDTDFLVYAAVLAEGPEGRGGEVRFTPIPAVVLQVWGRDHLGRSYS